MIENSEESDCIVLSRKGYEQQQKSSSVPILGKYCTVNFSNGTEFLCRVFCDINLSHDYTILGTKVGKNVLQHKPWSEANSLSIKISNRQVVPAKSLKVVAVFSSLKLLMNWKSFSKKSALIQDILSVLVIGQNMYVTTKSSPLAKPYGIDYVLIKDCGSEHLCRVNSLTKIEVIKLLVTEHAKQEFEKKNICTAGLSAEIQVMNNIIRASLSDTPCPVFWKGILVWGPPGCGRDIIPQALANENENGIFLMKVTLDSVVSSLVGESEQNLKLIFENARSYSRENPVILLIDNLETICPRRASSTSNQKRIAMQLISELDGIQTDDKIIVIGSTGSPESLDPALRRPGRMDKEVYIGMPDSKTRLELMIYYMILSDIKPNPKIVTMDLANRLVGYSRDDLERLIGAIASEKCADSDITEQDFNHALHQIKPSLTKADMLGVADHTETRWSEVGGLEHAKLAIKKAVEWPLKHPEAFQRFGIPKPRGVLLYGPPGCGKSLLVRAAATECSASFLSVKASEIFSSYVGDSEKIIVSLFKKARLMAPCILFLDELDSIVGSRESSFNSKNVQQGVISTLLQEMDGITASSASVVNKTRIEEGAAHNFKETVELISIPTDGVILIGATNRPDKIDPALLRPGRLDSHVFVPPPDCSARVKVLQIATKGMPLDGVDLNAVAERTNGYTGADLKFLCKEAGLAAMSENIGCSTVEMRHFEEALENVSSSVTSEDLLYYEAYINR